MATPFSPFQIAQIILITICFVFHLYTFYDLYNEFSGNMVIFEATVYGIYFIITLGQMIAILSGTTFTPPMEAMTKLYGAVLFNIVGLITFNYHMRQQAHKHNQISNNIFGVIKSICAIVVCILYYTECFQA